MKKLFTLIMVIFITLSVSAQSPEKMSYQSVIRNPSGVLITNQSVGIRTTILQGTPSGTVIYQETYSPNPQTNANGMVTVEIGGGFVITGTFATINWAAGPYFLRTETDPTGGTSYTIVGTSQLLSVPYALHAKTAATANYNDLSNLPSLNISNWNTAYGWGNHAGLYRPVGWVPAWGDVTGKPAFATVATSGSYLDLSNRPTILNSQWTTSGSNIYYNSGNVAIGTTNLNGLLHLYTNSTIASPHLLLTESEGDYARLTFKNTVATTKNWSIAGFTDAADANSLLNFWYWNGTSGEDILSISGTGKVGIGTYTPPYNLSIHGGTGSSEMNFINTYTGGTATDGLRIGTSSTGGNSWVWNYENARLYFGTNNSERMTILANGYVGIGNNSPVATLDVEGTVIIGSAGKIFSEIREITGTTAATGDRTFFSFPSGYTSSNMRVLSCEINYDGTSWTGMGGCAAPTSDIEKVFYFLGGSLISIYYPSKTNFQNRAYRMLVMKVQ